MEKNDPSDTEQEEVKPENVETIPAVKPKRKMNLTDEQRAVRADRMRAVALARIEKSRAVNAEVADKVKAIHKEAVQKGKKIRMKKAIEIQHQNLDTDSDSDSSVELPSSKKKRKNKSNQPIIIIKNYTSDKKKGFDASENVAKLKEVFREPSPPPQPVRLGYFV
jgi:uncharacterized protein (UPF0335 family)